MHVRTLTLNWKYYCKLYENNLEIKKKKKMFRLMCSHFAQTWKFEWWEILACHLVAHKFYTEFNLNGTADAAFVCYRINSTLRTLVWCQHHTPDGSMHNNNAYANDMFGPLDGSICHNRAMPHVQFTQN